MHSYRWLLDPYHGASLETGASLKTKKVGVLQIEIEMRPDQGCRKLVSVVSRILDIHGFFRQSGSQTLRNKAGPKVQLGQTKVIWLDQSDLL